MLGSPSDLVLNAMMPILDRGMQEEYERLTGLLKELITSDKENSQFTKAPVAYLKRRGALSLDKILLPNGQEVPTVQDNVLRDTIRKAREMYKDGKLKVGGIAVGFCYTRVVSSFYVAANERIAQTRSAFIRGYARVSKVPSVVLRADQMCVISGRNMLEIDGKMIGPLADPAMFKSLEPVLAPTKVSRNA